MPLATAYRSIRFIAKRMAGKADTDRPVFAITARGDPIDWHNREWHAKPIGFVSYGGMSGGLRAVEQLRQVFAELHAVTVRDTVSFHNFWDQFDAEGRPQDPESCEKAAVTMLDELAWWGRALREARERYPYEA